MAFRVVVHVGHQLAASGARPMGASHERLFRPSNPHLLQAMSEPCNGFGGAGNPSLQFPIRLELSPLANRGTYGRKSGLWQGLSCRFDGHASAGSTHRWCIGGRGGTLQSQQGRVHQTEADAGCSDGEIHAGVRLSTFKFVHLARKSASLAGRHCSRSSLSVTKSGIAAAPLRTQV